MSRLVIVGGSDAGISAGLRARELNPHVEPLLIVADAFPNFSICGIPYHVSGEVPDWRSLAHRTRCDLEAAGLELRLDTVAHIIDAAAQEVTVTGPSGDDVIAYDQLIIGTGARPVRPPIDGLEALGPADGVHVLHTMADTFALTDQLRQSPRSALIVGGGYIGVEMAEALRTRGLDVTMVEQLPQVLSTVDADLADLVRDELERHDVRVETNIAVTAISRNSTGLVVLGHGTNDARRSFRTTTDLVLVVVGVRPDTGLAESAGAEVGVRGAIAVDRRMRTTVANVWAAGDCVHTYHRVLGRNVYLPLGSTAHKQGRVAGANAVGLDQVFGGSVGTQVVKIFDLVAARTGLREHEAIAHGLHPTSTTVHANDHKAYYPGARPISIKLTADTQTGQLLGAQLIGHRESAVAKRADIYATALHLGMSASEISDLDLSYTPPLGSPYDAVQVAAHEWTLIHPRARSADRAA